MTQFILTIKGTRVGGSPNIEHCKKLATGHSGALVEWCEPNGNETHSTDGRYVIREVNDD